MTQEKIAFVKTGWSEEYRGGPVSGKHGYLLENKTGHERFNFLKAPNGRFYGYLPPIGRNYRPPQPKEKRGWLVIFVAAKNGTGPLTVIGWYKSAVFESEYQDRPEYQLSSGFEKDERGKEYGYCVYSQDGYLIPVADRYTTVPGQHFKRAPIIYAQQGNASDQDDWRKEFVKLAKQVMKSATSRKHNETSPYFSFPDPEHRKKVEADSMKKASSYMRAKGYSVKDISKEKRGYDLLAIKKSNSEMELHIEVKGTSGSIQRFFISRNEKLYMLDRRWRLLMVTDALEKASRISLMTSSDVEAKFKFSELAWEAILK